MLYNNDVIDDISGLGPFSSLKINFEIFFFIEERGPSPIIFIKKGPKSNHFIKEGAQVQSFL